MNQEILAERHLLEITLVCTGSYVSERIKWHFLSQDLKQKVLTGILTEGHLRAITNVVLTLELSSWLTSEQAWRELAELAGGVVRSSSLKVSYVLKLTI